MLPKMKDVNGMPTDIKENASEVQRVRCCWLEKGSKRPVCTETLVSTSGSTEERYTKAVERQTCSLLQRRGDLPKGGTVSGTHYPSAFTNPGGSML